MYSRDSEDCDYQPDKRHMATQAHHSYYFKEMCPGVGFVEHERLVAANSGELFASDPRYPRKLCRLGKPCILTSMTR